jgi:hypothetical protein
VYASEVVVDDVNAAFKACVLPLESLDIVYTGDFKQPLCVRVRHERLVLGWAHFSLASLAAAKKQRRYCADAFSSV